MNSRSCSFAFLLLALCPFVARATNPASGTITPLSTAPLTFVCTAPATGADSEPDAMEGINKDTYILTVGPGTYSGRLISVAITWLVAANDRDLYVFKRNADGSNGQQVGSSAGGAPQTGETVSFDPAIYGAGSYNVETIYFASTPNSDQPTGSIQLVTGPTVRSANYTQGGIAFSPDSSCKAPTASADTEPSSRIDNLGNVYICGIEGVPAGVDLWYFDLRPTLPAAGRIPERGRQNKVKEIVSAPASVPNPNYDPYMRIPLYRGKPDSPSSAAGQAQLQAGALGGGDIDLAVGIGSYTGDGGLGVGASATPVLAYASLTAANLTVGRSPDLGQTFQFNAAGNFAGGVPVNDRQWMGFLDDHTVYLEYRNFAQGVAFVQQSINGGLTYGNAVLVGTLPQTGALDVDRFDGTVYISGNDGHVAAGTPTVAGLPPLTYTIYQATPTPGVGNLFFPIRVAADRRTGSGTLTGAGTVYGAYSNGSNIYLVHSFDHGQHWSNPVQVSNPADPNLKINLFPWLATGPTPGSVGITWYATDGSINDPAHDQNLQWRVYYAMAYDATADIPNFRYAQAVNHVNHAANISLSGLALTNAPNRNLSDYFQINFDPVGAAVIAYTDDHNDFSGHTFATRQISGPAITGKLTPQSNGQPGNVPAPVEGSALPAQPFALPGTLPAATGLPAPQPMQPGPNGEQVTDFAQDQDSGLLATSPSNSPVDIITVSYLSQDSNQGYFITGTMKLSDLSTVPPSGMWRMYFTANAPGVGDGSSANLGGPVGNQFSKGQSDHGDMLWIDAETSASGTKSFNWGTTIRNSDGSTTDTTVGTASRGFFNTSNNTISVRMSVNTLNTYLDSIHGNDIAKHIQFGSVLCGLRGRSSALVLGLALEDATLGGTEFKIGNAF